MCCARALKKAWPQTKIIINFKSGHTLTSFLWSDTHEKKLKAEIKAPRAPK